MDDSVATAITSSRRLLILDVVAILLISFSAQGGRFAWQAGRYMINADSVQYVDGAESILDSDQRSNFAFRKPGYSLVLAAVALLSGNMGYWPVTINHAFCALLPVIAYGLGRNLRCRAVGWCAAVLVLAKLPSLSWADRLMSEVVYTFLLSLALLLLVHGVSRRRATRWLALAGCLLGFAWLVRSVASAVIVATLAWIVWMQWGQRRRLFLSLACICVPVFSAVLLECEMNRRGSSQFRTCHGTLGGALMMRARYMQGSEFPDTPTARACLALLPSRDPQDAYGVHKMDTWVARYNAIRTGGMDEWEFDALVWHGALEIIASDPWPYLWTTCKIAVRHGLRIKLGPPLAHYAKKQESPIPLPAGVSIDITDPYLRNMFWAVPRHSAAHFNALISRMDAAAKQSAPFVGTEPWTTLRYVMLLPAVRSLLRAVDYVGTIWPGFALIACGILGLNRKTCLLLGAIYIVECIGISAMSATDAAIPRFQVVWIVTDATLAAAFLVTMTRGSYRYLIKAGRRSFADSLRPRDSL